MDKNKVVICGTGVMGTSLAQVYALAGFDTYLYSPTGRGIEASKHLLGLNQEMLVKENLYTQEQSDAAVARIYYTTDKACFQDCFLVVENVLEDMEIKQNFFREISELVPEEAFLTTNTSGLSITEIQKAVKHPERFMGQHWLNPPHLLPLCEIIAGEKTDPARVQEMKELMESIGKMPAVVKDIPGFIINRLQFALLREALHIVDMGAATYEDVDRALKGGMGIRYAALGPCGVADFGGLDTFNKINSYLNAELDDSKVGNPALAEMVAEGKLGVKSGEGFYDYSGDKADEALRDRDKKYIEMAKILYFMS